jgi:hypothetical protein|tara:strand:- start:337 stop:549 length:213 start_codon:yes stop_codon:yes gene_type:complete
MDENTITPEFIDKVVDKAVAAITDKLEDLDISLDFLAAALLDSDAFSIGKMQSATGRSAVRRKRPDPIQE